MAGVPSMSVPCGFTSENLPIGMEIAGPQWAEYRLLQLGVAYQAVTDWHLRRPAALSHAS
jgi:aspartyl-tRNA(Asn)/glutamyl-tRNA(Gln) amidotransferase subunit A